MGTACSRRWSPQAHQRPIDFVERLVAGLRMKAGGRFSADGSVVWGGYAKDVSPDAIPAARAKRVRC